jgi:hypothetical protein
MPPLEPLLGLLAPLARAGFPHALGGSGLLAALGLIDRVNDWDVTIEAGVDAVAALYPAGGFARHGHGGGHADHKLAFATEQVELIVGFAFFVPGGVVRIPTTVTRQWRGVPVGSPAAWAAAYALMGEHDPDARRRDRAERLFGWMAEHGADAEGLARVLAEPLPDPIAGRLRALTPGA